MARLTTRHSLGVWLALLPPGVTAQEPLPPQPTQQLMLAEMNEMVLPSSYRCRARSVQALPSAPAGHKTFTPNGWELTVRAVLSDQPTRGLMLETRRVLSDTLKLRLGGGTMSSQRSGMLRDYHYDEAVAMSHIGVYLDWKRLPYDISLVGGVAWHNTTSEITLKPTPGLSYTLNNRLYTSAEIGLLSGSMSYLSTAPYLGLAWERQLGSGSRWRFSTDLGIIFNMQPELTLHSDSTVAGINDDVAVAANSLEHEFENRFFVATLGLSYGF